MGLLDHRFPDVAVTRDPAPRQIFTELKTPAAVLLSLILFFQLGNEWAIAGWLPLFLSQRLGISPETSLLMLALYWLALLSRPRGVPMDSAGGAPFDLSRERSWWQYSVV